MPRPTLFTVFALSVIPFCAHAQQYRPVTNLGTPTGYSYSAGSSVNNSGQVVGIISSYGGGFYGHAFLYSGGAMQDLGVLPNGIYSAGAGVNSAGQAVGYSYTSGGQFGFLYTSGTGMAALPEPAGSEYASASAVNDSGQVVGSGTIRVSGAVVPLLWSAGGVTTLGWSGSASGINNAGQIAGTSGFNNTHAVLYTPGAGVQDLGTLPNYNATSATALSSNGWVVGTYGTNASLVGGYAWTAESGLRDLGSLGGGFTDPLGVNAAGQVVGKSQVTGATAQHAFLWQSGKMTDLNSLVSPTSGWTLTSASSISDTGFITGSGLLNGQTRAFLIQVPAPEPSAWAVLAIGALCLGTLTLKAKRRAA